MTKTELVKEIVREEIERSENGIIPVADLIAKCRERFGDAVSDEIRLDDYVEDLITGFGGTTIFGNDDYAVFPIPTAKESPIEIEYEEYDFLLSLRDELEGIASTLLVYSSGVARNQEDIIDLMMGSLESIGYRLDDNAQKLRLTISQLES